MPNIINYATNFERQLRQKYSAGLKTAGLTTQNRDIRFLDAQTIKVPHVVMQGYKDHSRDGGFNRQAVENQWMTFTLDHDRDVEFFVDTMDVDETNQVLSAANTTNAFMEEQDIPETDVYRLSKLYSENARLGGAADTTPITPNNALLLFDSYMKDMDEAEVPEEGRELYVTPDVYTSLKQAEQISRYMGVNVNQGNIDRKVYSLDDVNVIKVPSSRMKSAYDFTSGFVPAGGAVQQNMILVQPKSVIAVDKHRYIALWAPGTHTVGDGWLYQNRKYSGLFLIDTRAKGVRINAGG